MYCSLQLYQLSQSHRCRLHLFRTNATHPSARKYACAHLSGTPSFLRKTTTSLSLLHLHTRGVDACEAPHTTSTPCHTTTPRRNKLTACTQPGWIPHRNENEKRTDGAKQYAQHTCARITNNIAAIAVSHTLPCAPLRPLHCHPLHPCR